MTMLGLQRLSSILHLTVLLNAVAQGSCQVPQSAGTILNDGMDTFINGVLADWNSPGGAAVGVVRQLPQGSWSIETKGYGLAKADGTKVDERTLFSIGSNSKLFDIIATGLLIHNETLSPRLSWQSQIGSLIPTWALMDPLASNRSTIIDLMSHRTGLPRHDFSYTRSDDVPSMLGKLKFLRPSAEFRDVWQYSNIMYAIISYLPTALLPSKVPFARYVKANIFDPLGLNSTTYSFDVANATKKLADGMSRQRTPAEISVNILAGGIPRPLPYFSQNGGEDGNAISGPGGVISDVVDMSKWIQTLLLNGVDAATNASVIPPDVIQVVSTGITVESGTALFPELSPITYGGGQERSTYRGHEIVEHEGSVPGFNSLLTRLPNDNFGFVVLTNDDVYGTLITEIIKARIIDQAFGLSPIDWNTRLKALAPTFLPPPPVSAPVNATPPSIGSLASLAGKYTNLGYQTIELCVAADPSSNVTANATQSCRDLVAQAPRILPGAVDPSVPTLLASFDTVWASHITVTHWSGDTFNLTGLQTVVCGFLRF
ncbi:beta-lactamase/transpeptidase-like protein [Infundibulicybe gibba]|nr:beta-lactamase/transpeptidase-like protein [Infundibulicybe gibba]